MGKDSSGYKVFVYENSMQIIELELDSGQGISAGVIFDNWIDEGIICETQSIKAVKPTQAVLEKLLNGQKNRLNRHNDSLTYFRNPSGVRKRIAFAVPRARQILPIHLSSKDDDFFCHKEAFICTDAGIEVIPASGRRLDSNFLSPGKSSWLRFRGDGIIFVHVGGVFKNKKLENQNLKLDRRSIVGFTGGIIYHRKLADTLKLNRSDTKSYFKGQLSGSGTVYLQSKPHKMPENAHRLTRDIRELANMKALQLYRSNLEKLRRFRWSKLQDLVKIDRLKLSLRRK
jgi:uncharacterized protein (AIM24 family)